MIQFSVIISPSKGSLSPELSVAGKPYGGTEHRNSDERTSNGVTGCAVKRWWSIAGVKPAWELVRSTQ